MKEKRTGKPSAKTGTNWKRVGSLSDRQIRTGIESDPEVLPTDAEFWRTARIVAPESKQTITIRLDSDLLEWLRKEKGYQTRINAVLRTYMDASLAGGTKSLRG
ncbi:MAG: BrnA antitoxin family protein [Acidobacteria bacterium]|nr:BrnA antitoxin family protein [Acidobacteriota bacterium]